MIVICRSKPQHMLRLGVMNDVNLINHQNNDDSISLMAYDLLKVLSSFDKNAVIIWIDAWLSDTIHLSEICIFSIYSQWFNQEEFIELTLD